MSEKFFRYHSAQRWLIKDSDIFDKNRLEAFKIICDHVKKNIETDRVGIWLFSADRKILVEELTVKDDDETTSGKLLSQADFPKYFKAIMGDNLIISADTLLDPLLSEFKSEYFPTFKIKSMLDAPIYSDGQLIGILCLEGLSTKHWDNDDVGFATFCADFVARSLEAERRRSYEEALEKRISYLESDRDQSLDELNEARLSLDYAIEGAELGKWSWNIATNRLKLDSRWFKKFGYTDEEVPKNLEEYVDYIHPEDRERVQKQVADHFENRTEHYESRYRIIQKDGSSQWILARALVYKRDENGGPLKMAGVNMNFSPSIQVEETLKHSERQLKAMVESLPIPVAMFDKNLNYIAFSSKWKEEWGPFADPEGMVEGKHMYTARPRWVDVMKQALTGIILSSEGDLVELPPDRKLWIKWTIQPWKNSAGNVSGVIVVAENITQKKETEIRLAQTSKLSALGEMAAGIAHEINNPLSIIKGYLDLLKRHSNRKSLSEDLLNQYVYKMDQTVGRISRIVSGMRRFSRESSLDEKTNYSLNKIISETLDICQERISNNGISITVNYFKKEATAFCHPVELSQVLLNLVNNSFQALVDRPRSWIRIDCEEKDMFYRIIVIDSGEGISIDVQEKLFQPFFTTKEVGVGTGLGLSISRGIMEEHKGNLYYDQDANNTSFVLEIPKATDMEDKKT